MFTISFLSSLFPLSVQAIHKITIVEWNYKLLSSERTQKSFFKRRCFHQWLFDGWEITAAILIFQHLNEERKTNKHELMRSRLSPSRGRCTDDERINLYGALFTHPTRKKQHLGYKNTHAITDVITEWLPSQAPCEGRPTRSPAQISIHKIWIRKWFSKS